MNDEPKSILKEWVTRLGLRYQGTLLTIIRGCDTWPKHALAKPLIREMRGLILLPYDERELKHTDGSRGFMTLFPDPDAERAFEDFAKEMDPLPLHYVMHLLHTLEIIGYCHPAADVREAYAPRYRRLAAKFHLHGESRHELAMRMAEDRVANNTVGQ